jgi:hypothetical protein
MVFFKLLEYDDSRQNDERNRECRISFRTWGCHACVPAAVPAAEMKRVAIYSCHQGQSLLIAGKQMGDPNLTTELEIRELFR